MNMSSQNTDRALTEIWGKTNASNHTIANDETSFSATASSRGRMWYITWYNVRIVPDNSGKPVTRDIDLLDIAAVILVELTKLES